jgi:GDP-L-fucose synthase
LNLLDGNATRAWLTHNRPDVIVLAAARVGGILANSTRPADFIFENLSIASNVIGGAFDVGVEKLLYLGSSCIYPKLAPQPITEDALLTGPLEPTNEWYAVAKIAGLKLCQAFRLQFGSDFISAMPTNLYGPGDKYDPVSSHVLPALIRKAHDAKLAGAGAMNVWGSGRPRREFLYVDDCADALVCVLKRYSDLKPINIGSGEDLSIGQLAEVTAEVIGFKGSLEFELDKPDGTPRKLLDVSRLNALGWKPTVELKTGIALAYEDYLCRFGSELSSAPLQTKARV